MISGGKEWDILRKTTVTAKSLENPLPETKTAPENRPFNAPKTNEKGSPTIHFSGANC